MLDAGSAAHHGWLAGWLVPESTTKRPSASVGLVSSRMSVLLGHIACRVEMYVRPYGCTYACGYMYVYLLTCTFDLQKGVTGIAMDHR